MNAVEMHEGWADQFSGKTKAEIVGLLFEQFQATGAMIKDRDAWRAHKNLVPEAEAIGACVRALDELKDRGSGSHPPAQIERILDFLRTRYLGVPSSRIEYVVPPQIVHGRVLDDLRAGDLARIDPTAGTIERASS